MPRVVPRGRLRPPLELKTWVGVLLGPVTVLRPELTRSAPRQSGLVLPARAGRREESVCWAWACSAGSSGVARSSAPASTTVIGARPANVCIGDEALSRKSGVRAQGAAWPGETGRGASLADAGVTVP